MKTSSMRVQASRCPHCQRITDAATSLVGRSPGLGDVSICIYCAKASVFGLGLVLESIPEPLLSEVLADPGVQQMQAAVRSLPRFRGARR